MSTALTVEPTVDSQSSSKGTAIDHLLGRCNLETHSWEPKPWDSDHAESSLQKMRSDAEKSALAAMHWYWDKKRWKAITSRVCRFAAILLPVAAALIPNIASMGLFGPSAPEPQSLWTLKMNQVGYLCLGLAALALALDRFLSGSASWMRYVSTATSIQTAVEKFRLDWDKLTASLEGKTPSGQDLVLRINRIAEFSGTVRALVESETAAWVAEFQANLAELQKGTAAAVETARAQVQEAQKKIDEQQQAAQQKADAARQAAQQKADAEQLATRPGGIDLAVENAAETDDGYEVLLDGVSKKTGVIGNNCGILGISPGLHELSVTGTIGGTPAHASQLVTISAGTAAKAQITLAKRKAVGAS